MIAKVFKTISLRKGIPEKVVTQIANSKGDDLVFCHKLDDGVWRIGYYEEVEELTQKNYAKKHWRWVSGASAVPSASSKI